MGWKLKVGEGAVSVTIGWLIVQEAVKLWEGGDQQTAAVLGLIGFAMIVVNMLVLGKGVAELVTEMVTLRLGKRT